MTYFHATPDGLIPFTPEEESQFKIDSSRIQAEENERRIKLIREKRNLLLTESDWTQLPDAPVDSQSWAEYRQKLRDITIQAKFPNEIVWPEHP